MKALVLGAGEVGYHIALRLSREGNDIVVVDQDADRLQLVEEAMDVATVCGRASLPSVLERAGAADADLLIAATTNDEVNMLACQVAHSLFRVPLKIARVREAEYNDERLIGRDDLPIDHIISPESEAARAVVRRVQISAASDMQAFAGGKVMLIGMPVEPKSPLAGAALAEIQEEVFGDVRALVVAHEHNHRWQVPTPDATLLAGDSVYLSVAAVDAQRLLARLGRAEQAPGARNVFQVGGGRIGFETAKRLEALGYRVKLVERDRQRAEWLAERLQRTVVIAGDAINKRLLEEECIDASTDFLALTNDDESNILVSLIARRYGVPHVVTLINRTLYNEMARDIGLDVTICPRLTTVSSILRHARRGRVLGAAPLGDGSIEVLEAEALETALLVGKPLKEVNFPAQAIVAAIVRDDDVIIPDGNTRIEPHDDVVLVARSDTIRKLERLFEVQLEFF